MYKVSYSQVNNIKMRDNARNEEILAALALGNTIFKGEKVIIGDMISNKEPDIFAADYSKGMEVVTCEPVEIYKKLNYKKGKMKFSKPANDTTKNSTYKNYLDVMELENEVNNSKKYTENIKADKKLEKQHKERYFLMLAKNIESKLEKLNNNSYGSCDKNYLVVMSNLVAKPYLKNEEIEYLYNKLGSKYAKKFEDLYVVHNDEVHKIGQNEYINTPDQNKTVTNKKDVNLKL